MSEKTVKETVRNIIAQFSGQNATLTIPRPYITATGSLEAALLLSQIVYWSDRSTMKDGWFAKSYVEWESELTLSKYQVMKAVEALKPAGVEKALKKFNGAPTVHYRLNMEVFLQWIVEKLDNPGLSKNLTIQSEETSQSSTEITSEITIDSYADKSARRNIPKRKTIPAEQINPMKDAIVTAFGWDWKMMAGAEKGVVQKTAKELCEAALTPDRVESLYAYCKSQFTNPGPRALAAHLSEWRKARLNDRPASSPPSNIISYTPGIENPPPAAVSDEEIPF